MFLRSMKKRIKTGIVLLGILLLIPLQLKVSADGNNAPENPQPKTDPIGRGNNYSSVLYDNTNGLLTSEANTIAQTGEGFIWIGSYSGLIRYDGHTFERMDSSTGITSVVDLYVDHLDRLWIGTNDNGVALMENGEFRRWDVEDGLGASKIQDIAEDDDGIIYIATAKGISMIYPDLTLHNVDEPMISNLFIDQIMPGSNGILHCITNEDDYFTLKDGKLVEYSNHAETPIEGMLAIYPDPESPGELYIGAEESIFYHGFLNKDSSTMEQTDISPLFNVFDIEKIGNRIWITAINGVGYIENGKFHYLKDLPMNDSIGTIMEDYEGNLWFTSTKQGVMKVVSNPFTDVFKQYGMDEYVVNATCLYDDKLFVATNTGLLVIGKGGQLQKVPIKSILADPEEGVVYNDLVDMLDGCRIRSVLCDNQGYLWISTWRAYGLLRYDGKELRPFTEKEGLKSDHIRAVTETADGKIVVALTGGVSVIEKDKVVAGYGEADGIENSETLCVETAPNGDILAGSNGGGIYIINEEGVRCLNKEEGLSSGVVMRIKYDAVNKVFWIVTGNSIAWMTEDYDIHTVDTFPYSNNFDLYQNNRGEMWVLSSDGIYVLPVDALLENEAGKTVHYGIANGLPCVSTSNSYCELTEDGDLYLSGNRGVVRINIDAPFEDVENIKQSVPFMEADGKRIYPNENGEFVIPADAQRLAIYGYVFNYSLTDPLVTYYLDGFDRESVTVQRSDLGPVIYTNLPGGSYQFVMEIKNAMGEGSKTLSVPLIKKKRFYEHIWFYVLCGVLTIGITVGNVFLFSGLKARKMEKRHKEEMDKQRLATELRTASRIQSSILPDTFPPFPERDEFEIYASMDPAKEVGGDFYDFFFIDEDHLCLVIADVSGKGIPASLFMMVSKTILQNNARFSESVPETLARANEALCANNRAEMFVTVWMGILEISTGKITASNAGHEYPAVMHDGKFSLLKDKHGLAVAVAEGVKYTDYEITLAPGDKLFVYTDGVPEATDAKEELFGTDRMVEALNVDPTASPEQVMANVRHAVDDFVKEAEQFDDLTMLCIEYKGKQS